MNNPHYRTDFENLRVPQLESIYNGIDHKVEILQEKLAADMGRNQYLESVPNN